MPPDTARAEARRRLVEALSAHRWVGASCSCGVPLPTGIDGHLADVVLDLVEIGEECRVEGTDPETDEDEGGDWVIYADDWSDALSLAERHGGTPVVTLLLSLPVPVAKESADA